MINYFSLLNNCKSCEIEIAQNPALSTRDDLSEMKFPAQSILDQSISILRVVGWYFHSNFNRTFCMQNVKTLIRSDLSRLFLPISHKKC